MGENHFVIMDVFIFTNELTEQQNHIRDTSLWGQCLLVRSFVVYDKDISRILYEQLLN